jgi:hypothetical protein
MRLPLAKKAPRPRTLADHSGHGISVFGHDLSGQKQRIMTLYRVPGQNRALRKIPQKLGKTEYEERLTDPATTSSMGRCYNPRLPPHRLYRMRPLRWCFKDMNLVERTETDSCGPAKVAAVPAQE